MSQYKVCPQCGAHLDHCERCDCRDKEESAPHPSKQSTDSNCTPPERDNGIINCPAQVCNAIELLERICESENIHMQDIALGGKTSGVAIRIRSSDFKGILYNPSIKGWHKVYVLAHELAHLVLGHFGDDALVATNYFDKESENRVEFLKTVESREREAQTFGAAFTAMALFSQYTKSGSLTR